MPVPGPDTRVVELRIHGDAGSRGDDAATRLLDAVTAVDVAGDGASGRFVRPGDRLRRPAPGPMLAGGSRSTPRIVEGFLAGATRWWLAPLFPFWLVNVAFWMLPRIADGGLARLCGVSLRALTRVQGALLSLLLLAQLAALADPARLGPVPLAVTGALIACWLVFVAVLVPAALLARREAEDVPKELRPWAGGLFAAPVLLLAVFLGGGFGAALGHLRMLAFGGPPPAGYPQVAALWVLAAAVTSLAGLASLVVALVRGVGPAVTLLQTGDTLRRAAAAWRWAGWQRGVAHRLVLTAACTLGLGAVLAAAGVRVPMPWAEPVAAAGLVVLGLILLALVRLTALPEHRLGALGALVRVAGSWPVRAHPLVPRPFTDDPVPGLVARAKEHLNERNARLVLTGEGHGGLLASLAALRLLAVLPEAERARLGLVVAGSGLRWVYPKAFPAVLGYPELVDLSLGLGERWRSLCRGTDPLGGGVTTWRPRMADGELFGTGLVDGGASELPAAESAPTGALVLGGDHWLPDPAAGPVTGRRWVAGVRRHAEYVAEEEWDRAVAVASGLDTAGGVVEQAALFRLPSKWSAPGRRTEADSA